MSELSILVIAEHNNQVLAVDTLRTLQAAKAIGGEVSVLVMGAACAAVAEAAKTCAGVSHVLLAESPAYEHRLAENGAALVADIARSYSHVLAPATTFGKNLLPRVAALIDVGQLSDVIAIESPDTVVRPIYAGNALAKVKSLDAIKVMTIRSSAFDAVASAGGNAEVKTVDHVIESATSQFVSQQKVESARPELPAARVVISGGRGLGSKENFALVEQLADKLGGAIGASRAAVDAGFVSNDLQVGQTGKIVAPELYIAVGISGAIQHLAGMKDSKVIVAINSDPDAPIFQIADYGLVGDLFEIMPALIQSV
ncbi:electron transfer flavoprotein subunit alpha/FixB family protein [Vibrio furnissii]|uniref:electron transfer flavoprotein subunit alpha/FixB family protein n=1 Tax=Vibrio furnissii TaxID=29494 RepID=UPI001E390288|nr:FAD-binding protein [Vibrio furnissii]UHJ63204.1 FAD-binding protein [Vibrio furnissii]